MKENNMKNTIFITALLMSNVCFAATAEQTAQVKTEILQTTIIPVDTASDQPQTKVSFSVVLPKPEEQPKEPAFVTGLVRMDQDYMFGLQAAALNTFRLNDNFGLSTNVYVSENMVVPTDTGYGNSYWGEFDVGPAFNYKWLTVTPMVGVAFDWAIKKPIALNGPQLYTIINTDKLYLESWVYSVFYSVFDDIQSDYIHTRNWALYKLNDKFAVGPQVEYSYNLQTKRTVYAAPVGGHIDFTYESNSVGLFLGYDVSKITGDDGRFAGRLSYLHFF